MSKNLSRYIHIAHQKKLKFPICCDSYINQNMSYSVQSVHCEQIMSSIDQHEQQSDDEWWNCKGGDWGDIGNNEDELSKTIYFRTKKNYSRTDKPKLIRQCAFRDDEQIQQSDSSTDLIDEQIQQSDSSTDRIDEQIQQSDLSTDLSTKKSKLKKTVTWPQIVVTSEHVLPTSEPESSTPEPESSTPEPESSTPEPESSTPEPESVLSFEYNKLVFLVELYSVLTNLFIENNGNKKNIANIVESGMSLYIDCGGLKKLFDEYGISHDETNTLNLPKIVFSESIANQLYILDRSLHSKFLFTKLRKTHNWKTKCKNLEQKYDDVQSKLFDYYEQ